MTPDLTYKRGRDGFVAFFPETGAGHIAWCQLVGQNEGPRVFGPHAAQVIAKLRAAGYVVKQARNRKVDTDLLLEELQS